MRITITAASTAALLGSALFGAAHAQAPGQQTTQPSLNQNQPQLQQNQGQQAPQARPAGEGRTQGQSYSQPSANQNQPQVQQNSGQRPRVPQSQ